MRRGLSELLAERTVLLDGAMGSALMERGLTAGSCPEQWNIERPEDVLAVHASYVAAGSDVVQTNTFGANPSSLARHGLADQLEDINRRAVDLARQSAGNGVLVAGNIGPSGRLLAPYGDADSRQLTSEFGAQAAVLAGAGVDYIAIETMMDLGEALAALDGATTCGLPVTVCLTFDEKPSGFFTMMGQSPTQCAVRLTEKGAVAVGANCSIGSSQMPGLCAQMVAATDIPVVAKPNAGLPDLDSGQPVYRQAPAEFAADMVGVVSLGVRAVGGCCGTDARFIEALGKNLGIPPGRDD